MWTFVSEQLWVTIFLHSGDRCGVKLRQTNPHGAMLYTFQQQLAFGTEATGVTIIMLEADLLASNVQVWLSTSCVLECRADWRSGSSIRDSVLKHSCRLSNIVFWLPQYLWWLVMTVVRCLEFGGWCIMLSSEICLSEPNLLISQKVLKKPTTLYREEFLQFMFNQFIDQFWVRKEPFLSYSLSHKHTHTLSEPFVCRIIHFFSSSEKYTNNNNFATYTHTMYWRHSRTRFSWLFFSILLCMRSNFCGEKQYFLSLP